jgi:hypothetical protein
MIYKIEVYSTFISQSQLNKTGLRCYKIKRWFLMQYRGPAIIVPETCAGKLPAMELGMEQEALEARILEILAKPRQCYGFRCLDGYLIHLDGVGYALGKILALMDED